MPENSQQAEMWNAQAVQAAGAGRLDVAAELMGRAIAAAPRVPAYHRNLGEFFRRLKRYDQAIAACNKAIELDPNSPESYFNLATILKDARRYNEAINAYRQTIRLNPASGPAFNNLGTTLREADRAAEAVEVLQQAVALRPDHAAPYNNLGLALTECGRLDEADAALRNSIRLNPGSPQSYLNLSNVLEKQNRLDEALATVHQAVSLDPRFAEAYSNLGNVLSNLGRFDEALAAYEHGVQLDPANAEAHFNLSFSLLVRGDFERGWTEYEWRRKCRAKHVTLIPLPRWDGQELGGRTILLHSEQGLGDAIQFSRYAELVAARGGRVILECRPELHRLFAHLAGAQQLVTRKTVPPFQVHCPLLSLPAALRTKLETIPRQVPYLFPDPALKSQWAQRLIAVEQPLRVGLVWAGSHEHVNDRRRSMPVEKLAPLAQARADVALVSLQKRYKPVAETAPPELKLIDWTAELSDFADTAALVANLDLVIAVDTAVAHLAGAIGKPVWLMLPLMPDWRWLLHRKDSPWYPTMRIFRQRSPGDWEGVVREVADALRTIEIRSNPAR